MGNRLLDSKLAELLHSDWAHNLYRQSVQLKALMYLAVFKLLSLVGFQVMSGNVDSFVML